MRLLLQPTDDSTVADIAADRIYSGGLNDDGETLRLFDSTGALVDWANAGCLNRPSSSLLYTRSTPQKDQKKSTGGR